MQNRDHITWMELAQACKALALQEVVSVTLEDQLRELFAELSSPLRAPAALPGTSDGN